MWINSKGTFNTENQQFGPSLQAAPYTSAGKDVIYVPSYYEDKFSRQNKPPWETVVEEAVNSRESMEQPGKEKAQYGGNINTKSFLNSNSHVGMEGISHEIIQYSIPNISKSTLQSDLVTPTV